MDVEHLTKKLLPQEWVNPSRSCNRFALKLMNQDFLPLVGYLVAGDYILRANGSHRKGLLSPLNSLQDK